MVLIGQGPSQEAEPEGQARRPSREAKPEGYPTAAVESCGGRIERGRKNGMIGILVNGGNHFIVRGPHPDRATALALVRHWSLIRIGSKTPPSLEAWSISSREFREDLQWAMVAPGDGAV